MQKQLGSPRTPPTCRRTEDRSRVARFHDNNVRAYTKPHTYSFIFSVQNEQSFTTNYTNPNLPRKRRKGDSEKSSDLFIQRTGLRTSTRRRVCPGWDNLRKLTRRFSRELLFKCYVRGGSLTLAVVRESRKGDAALIFCIGSKYKDQRFLV